MVFDVVCDNHLAIFYPLPYFELDAINEVFDRDLLHLYHEYAYIKFHWVIVNDLSSKDFRDRHISAFDYQVISRNSRNMTERLLGDQDKSTEYKGPDYAIMLCDNRQHLSKTAELLFMGPLLSSNETWEFYNAEKFERPSTRELKDIKGIIIPSSYHSIKNKVPKDESFIK